MVGPKGDDGQVANFQVSNGYIQWKYPRDTTWPNLLDLLSLSGSGLENGSIADRHLVISGVLDSIVLLNEKNFNHLGGVSAIDPIFGDISHLIEVELINFDFWAPMEAGVYDVIPTETGYLLRGGYGGKGQVYWIEVTVENGDLSYEIEDNDGTIYTMVYTNTEYNYGWTLYDGEIPVINKEYSTIEYMEKISLWLVKNGDLYGLLDSNFDEILEPIYDYIEFDEKLKFIEFSLNDNYGYLTIEGDLIVPALYDYINYEGWGNLFIVNLGPILGVYTIENGLVLSVEYYAVQYIDTDESGGMEIPF